MASRSEPLTNQGRDAMWSSGGSRAPASPRGGSCGGPVAGRRPTVVRQSEDLRLLQRGERISLGLSTNAPDAAACAGGRMSFDTRDEDPEILQALLGNLALGQARAAPSPAAAASAAAARRSLGGPRIAYVPQYSGIPERSTGSSLEEELEDAAHVRHGGRAGAATCGGAALALEAQSLLGGRVVGASAGAAAAAGAPRMKRSFEEPPEAAVAAQPPLPPPRPAAARLLSGGMVPAEAPLDAAAVAAALKETPAIVLGSALFAPAPLMSTAAGPPVATAKPPVAGDRRSFGSDEDTTTMFETWKASHPCMLNSFDRFLEKVSGKRVVVFLDYDGTLTPIVSNPDHAFMSPSMRGIVKEVGRLFPTAIISGRGRLKVEDFVQLDELFYAGSHGLDIKGPVIQSVTGEEREVLPLTLEGGLLAMMAEVKAEAEAAVASIPGATVEDNKYSVSVHFRNCHLDDWPKVFTAADEIVQRRAAVHMTRGRKVLEIRPRVNWDKGRALLHLLRALGLADAPDVLPLYIGDDRTDEDAFRVLRASGVGVLVSSISKATAASFTLNSPAEVGEFLSRLVEWGQQSVENAWRHAPTCVGWAATPPVAAANSGDTPSLDAAAAAAMPHQASDESVSTQSWGEKLRFGDTSEGGSGDSLPPAGAAGAPQAPLGGMKGSGHDCLSAVSSDCSTDMETAHGGKGGWLRSCAPA